MSSSIDHSSFPWTSSCSWLAAAPASSLSPSVFARAATASASAASLSDPATVVATALPALLFRRVSRRTSNMRTRSSSSSSNNKNMSSHNKKYKTSSRALAAFCPPLPDCRSFVSSPSPAKDRRTLRKVSEAGDHDQALCSVVSSVSSSPLFRPDRVSLRETLGSAAAASAKYPQVVGHRGAPYRQLENTLAGFQHCVDIGCHAVELDVFLLHDTSKNNDYSAAAALSFDNLICFHGGGGDAVPGDLRGYVLNHDNRNIRDLSLSDISQLQFNPNHSEFACPADCIVTATVPTLEQVLRALKDTGTRVQVELKGYKNKRSPASAENPSPEPFETTNTDVLEPCLALVEHLDMFRQVRFSSFDHDLLAALHELKPDATLGALFNQEVPDNYIQVAQACGAKEVHLRYDTCTAARVAEIHAAGLGSLAWVRGPVGMRRDYRERFYHSDDKQGATSDVDEQHDGEDADCYQAILDTGVQQLCCNKPDLLKELLLANGKNLDPTASIKR